LTLLGDLVTVKKTPEEIASAPELSVALAVAVNTPLIEFVHTKL
jgi:hypothetical protein